MDLAVNEERNENEETVSTPLAKASKKQAREKKQMDETFPSGTPNLKLPPPKAAPPPPPPRKNQRLILAPPIAASILMTPATVKPDLSPATSKPGPAARASLRPSRRPESEDMSGFLSEIKTKQVMHII